MDFLELRQVLSTSDGDFIIWLPQERPVPMRIARGLSGFLSLRSDQKCNALKNLIENRSQTIAPVTQLREKKRTHIRSIGSWECIPVLICAYCRHDAQHNQKRAYSLFAWNYLEMLFMAMDDSDACKTLASGSMAQTEQKKRSSISRRPSDQTSGSHLSVLPYYLLTNFTEVLTSSEAAATYAVNVPSSSVHPPRAGS